MSVDLGSLYATQLSSLHYEIESFAADVVPTSAEKVFYEDLISVVDSCAADLLGRRAKVSAFGSYAMGLSTHASDLDLVILNVLRVHSDGFRVQQRARAVKILYQLANRIVQGKAIKINKMRVIARARVPVLKICTKDGVIIDLLVHNPGGVKAAKHTRHALQKFPTSRPVTLVLKCMLSQAGLMDVSFGGLGGYALANMVLTHCMELRRLGRPDLDCGEVLLGVLERFGNGFDLCRQAVSSRRGEIVKKSVLEKETLEWIRNTDSWQGRTNNKPKPFIEDPLTGRNLAIGTTRFSDVQSQFREALVKLEGREEEDSALHRLFDVDAALQRTTSSPRIRGCLPVKKALKQEDHDRQMAREDIRAEKRRRASSGSRRRRRSTPKSLTPSRPSCRVWETTLCCF